MEFSVKCPLDQIIAFNLHITETVFSNRLEGTFSSNAIVVGEFRHCPFIRPVYVVCLLVTRSCPTLCHPMNYSPPGSLSIEFSRQECCSKLPFPSPGPVYVEKYFSSSVPFLSACSF